MGSGSGLGGLQAVAQAGVVGQGQGIVEVGEGDQELLVHSIERAGIGDGITDRLPQGSDLGWWQEILGFYA